MKKSILTAPVYQEVISRLEHLQVSNKKLWGTMTVTEMLCHCKQPLRNALGITKTVSEANPIKSLVFKISCLHILRKFPHNAPTGAAYKIISGTVSETEFEKEKAELKSLISQFYHYPVKEFYQMHPLFGKMDNEEWGKISFMHLDHHFRQFSN